MDSLDNIQLFIQTTLKPNGPANEFATIFSIGNFSFGYYQLFFIIGFFISIIIGSVVVKVRYKVSYDILIWFSIILIPSAILGARLWSAIIGDLKWENFFSFKSGGLAIQGGVLLSLIVAMIYFPLILRNSKYHVREEDGINVRISKPSMWIMVDTIIPLILFGQAIGRWGNFFNGEIFGSQVSPDSLHWLKIIMPGVYENMQAHVTGAASSGLIDGAFYQPLFLYESVLNIFFFMIIYLFLPNFKQIKIGVIGSSYFVIYGIIRFIFETMRFKAYQFTNTYVINGLFLFLGLILIILAQFIAPKYREKQIIYMIWIKYIRFYLIKVGIKLNIKKALQYQIKDKTLKNYGFEKPYNFIRSENNPIYYANR